MTRKRVGPGGFTATDYFGQSKAKPIERLEPGSMHDLVPTLPWFTTLLRQIGVPASETSCPRWCMHLWKVDPDFYVTENHGLILMMLKHPEYLPTLSVLLQTLTGQDRMDALADMQKTLLIT